MNSTKTRITLNILIPTLLVLPLILGYFKGGETLAEIIAPSFNRELGLLENLQNVVLLGILGVLVYAVRSSTIMARRAIFGFFALGTLFMFLEEMDYGLHWYEFLRGMERGEAAEIRNVHNQGISTPLKQLGDIVLFGFFGFTSLLFANSKHALLRYIAPNRFFIASLLLMLLFSRFGHYLNDHHLNPEHPLRKGVSEFRELFTYYLVLIYFIELTLFRHYGRKGAPPHDVDRGVTEGA
jgi:hypothetical protein